MSTQLQQEQQVSSIADKIPILISELSTDYRYKYINSKNLEFLGKTASEVVGKTVVEVLGRERGEVVCKLIDKAVAEGEARDETIYFEHPSGPQSMQVTLFADYDAAGVCKSVISVATNVTSEKALNESEEKLSLIFNHSTQLICLLEVDRDRNMYIDRVNAALLEVQKAMGKPATQEQLHGMRMQEYFIDFMGFEEEASNERVRNMQLVIEHGQPVTYREESENPHSGLVVLESTVSPIFKNGVCTNLLWVSHDVTELVKAKMKVIESEKQLSLIFNNTSEMMFLASVRADGHLVYETMNKVMADMVKASPGFETGYELIGMTVEDVFRNVTRMSEEDLKIRLGYYDEVILNKKRLTHRSKTGRPGVGILHHETTITPVINDDGKVDFLLTMIRDITQEVEIRRTVDANEEMLNSIIQDQTEMIVRWKPDGTRTFVNKAYCEMFGLTPDGAIGKSFFPQLMEKTQNEINDICANLTPEQPVAAIVHQSRLENGRTSWQEWTHRGFFDDDGNIVEFQSVGRDITESKIAQQALEESEEKFKSIVQDQTEMISRWLPGGIRTFVNDAYCKLFGVTREQVLGTSFFEEIAEPDRERVLARLNAITADNPISTASHEVILADGSSAWQEWTDRGFFDDDGKIIEYQSVGRDITEKTLAEIALRDSEEKYRILIDNIPSVSWATDDKGITTFISSNVTDIIGFSPEEIYADSDGLWFGRVHPDDLEATRQAYGDFFSGKTNEFSAEYRYRHRDGRWIWLADRANTTSIVDGKKKAYGVFSDVTASKEAEYQLQKAFQEVNRLKARLEMENIYLKQEILLQQNFEDMVYTSPKIKEVLAKVEQVAPVDTTVLISGETGTGKELIARALHNLSQRNSRPMIKLNCGAIPKELVESELFGHEKGAFTGATEKKLGKFELANGSTIFLDEFGEMPLETQVKLLRVLQEGEFERIGATKTIKVDVRVIAATNRDLKKAIEEGDFRQDLFYRLNVFPIHIPALRERKDDIPVLTDFFIQKFSDKYNRQIQFISQEVREALNSYEWPGNVRELENMVERSVITSNDGTVRFPEIVNSVIGNDGPSESLSLKLSDVERSHITKVLHEYKWKISGDNGAAAALGLKPSTLRDRMKKLGIERPAKDRTSKV